MIRAEHVPCHHSHGARGERPDGERVATGPASSRTTPSPWSLSDPMERGRAPCRGQRARSGPLTAILRFRRFVALARLLLTRQTRERTEEGREHGNRRKKQDGAGCRVLAAALGGRVRRARCRSRPRRLRSTSPTSSQKDVPVYSGAGRPDRRVPGRRDPRARRRLPRDRELPRRLLRAQGRSPLLGSTASRSRRRSRRRRPIRRRPKRGSQRPTTTSTATRRSSPSRPSASRSSTTRMAAAGCGARRRSRPRKAAVEKATLDLGYTRVTSPINGLVGTTQVKPGNLVGRGENTLLTTISQIDPILFRVGVTEADYLRVAQARSGARRRGAARRGHPADACRRHASIRTPGSVGAGRARGRSRRPARWACSSSFPTPTSLLRPGQYGRARILLETKAGRAARPAARRAGTAEPLQRGGRRTPTTRWRSAT